jgi:hypothetical protein
MFVWLRTNTYHITGGFYLKLKQLWSTCIAGGFLKDCLTKEKAEKDFSFSAF